MQKLDQQEASYEDLRMPLSGWRSSRTQSNSPVADAISTRVSQAFSFEGTSSLLSCIWRDVLAVTPKSELLRQGDPLCPRGAAVS